MPHLGIISSTPPEGLNFTHTAGSPLPRLGGKKGGTFQRRMDTARDFAQNQGKSWTARRRLRGGSFRALTADKGAQCWAPFPAILQRGAVTSVTRCRD